MRKSIVLSMAMVLCVLALLLFGLAPESVNVVSPPGPAVLIVQDDTGAFLLQVKQGAQQAASEVGCALGQETVTKDTLTETVTRWEQRGTSAALLLIEDANLREETATAFETSGIHVVVLRDQRANGAYVAMDERQVGALLAEFAQNYGMVYLLGEAPQRLEGVMDVLTPTQAILSATPAPEEQGCMIALTEEETHRLAILRASGEVTAPLAGMDPGASRVAWMADGIVDALAMDTPYAMGYTALKMALAGERKACLLPYRLVVKQEMYTAQNVKLMFPLLH